MTPQTESPPVGGGLGVNKATRYRWPQHTRSRCLDAGDVRQVAHGRWRDILADLGIPPQYLTRRHGPCPMCGGPDRYRYDDGRGNGDWYCNQCGGPGRAGGGGDGISLVMRYHGWDFLAALEAVGDTLGMSAQPLRSHPVRSHPPQQQPPRSQSTAPSRTRQLAVDLYRRCNRRDDVVAGHPYARAKGIDGARGAGRARVSYGQVVGRGADCIIVPARDRGTGPVLSVQAIAPGGAKQTFGALGDAFLALGNTLNPDLPVHVVEGWSTGVWFLVRYEFHTVVLVAFGAGRMRHVAEIWRDDHHPRRIAIAHEA